MFNSITAIVSLTVAAVSAAPSNLESRDIWQPCATNSLDGFTLAAWNTTMPNTNSTGTPLVLGYGSAFEGDEYYFLSTYASYPYDDYPSMTLTNGALTAKGNNVAEASYTDDGNELTWNAPPQDPPQVGFCATAGNDSYTLAIHGDPNSWWLCPGRDSQISAVYKPDQNHGNAYDYDRCYPVLLKIVENSS